MDTQKNVVTTMLKKAATHWRVLFDLGLHEATEIIKQDKIDILIDLSGHTGGNRLDLFTTRLAQYQINWIGYPFTTALKQMDFRIVDYYTDPEDNYDNSPEKLIKMPQCFLCYSGTTPVPIDEGKYMSSNVFTFGSFNNWSKINEAQLDVWLTILSETSNTRLILKIKPLKFWVSGRFFK